MNECVLVVDDDREIVKAIGLLLEKEGYRVLKAYEALFAPGAGRPGEEPPAALYDAGRHPRAGPGG